MATTATLVTLVGKAFPFIGLDTPPAQSPNLIPSAELVFVAINTLITAAAGGFGQSLLIQCGLPRSFCYVLAEAYMRIGGVNGDDWDSETAADLHDSGSVATITIPFVFNAAVAVSHTTEASTGRSYKANPPPNKIIVPLVTDDARFDVLVLNTVIDGAVATLQFYARFLRYDRNQAQYWQVNTPVLIR